MINRNTIIKCLLIKVFESSFSGQTLWDNPKYVTPTAKRSMLKRLNAHKYQSNVQAKAAYLASRPKDSTYKVLSSSNNY